MYQSDTSWQSINKLYRAPQPGSSKKDVNMRSKADVLELAILGLLQDSPMHGYELRKQLKTVLGPFRALSYGSLYPALKRMVERGWIEGVDDADTPPQHALSGKRSRISYSLTPAGKAAFQEVLTTSGPGSWEDDGFGVRFAFFAQTDAETRLRILEGRRTRLTEQLENIRESYNRTRERMDAYTLELQRHGLEQVESEVAWLDQMILSERTHGRLTKPGLSNTADPANPDGATASPN